MGRQDSRIARERAADERAAQIIAEARARVAARHDEDEEAEDDG